MTALLLVIDNSESNIKLLQAYLDSEYYTIITATSGKEGLQAMKNNKVDLVLLDAMMPEMDGFEVCKIIKSNPNMQHIPVVIVSALSCLADRIKGLELGADEFLSKPLNSTTLIARVRSLTRIKAVIDELKLRNQTSSELGGKMIETKTDFSNKDIIIIDDDDLRAKNVKSKLTLFGENIQIMNSKNYLQKVNKTTPHLAIISCNNEDDSSLRIGTELRAKPNFKNTILMLLAEDSNRSQIITSMEIGFNDYFMYPIDQTELQARIKTQIKRQQYQQGLRDQLEANYDLATKDSLTGLFNKRYFDTHIKQMFKNFHSTGKPICLMMLDMDHFKEVNDTYGHLAGDAVLITLAEIFKDSLRSTDFICRYGGEEFVILLNSTKLSNGIEIAEKIRLAVEKTEFVIHDEEDKQISEENEQLDKTISINKTISIGIAETKSDDSIIAFINRADQALYQAKSTGRNKVIVGTKNPEEKKI